MPVPNYSATLMVMPVLFKIVPKFLVHQNLISPLEPIIEILCDFNIILLLACDTEQYKIRNYCIRDAITVYE